MPRLNDLHDVPCRDCNYLDYYGSYICLNENLPEEFRSKYLFRGAYIPGPKDLDVCPYFIPREACIPSDEVKECQFWCRADHHRNPEECPLWELRKSNI